MKNNAKRIFALALVLILCLSVSAFGAEESGISLRIEGTAATLFVGEAEIADDGTVWSSVAAVLDANGISYDASEGTYGLYVSSIGDDYAGKYGSWSGWMYMVNGISPSVGMGNYTLSDGDEVVLYFCAYTDDNIADTAVPLITVSPSVPKPGDDVTVTVSKEVGYYDEDWNYIAGIVPVEGASVTFDGTAFITDADGKVTVPAVAAGVHTYSVAQEGDSYAKLVRTGDMRLAVSDTNLPVYVEASATAEGIKVTLLPIGDVSTVQIAYSYKDGKVPVGLVEKEVNITDGYTEEIAVEDGRTVYISVFTDYEIGAPISGSNVGIPAGAAVITK